MTAAMTGAPTQGAPVRQLVGVSAAARALGYDKGTISRHVKAGKIRNHAPDGAAPLIDVAEARLDLDRNLDLSKQRGQGAALYDEPRGGEEPATTNADPSATSRQAGAASTAAAPGGTTTTTTATEDDEAGDAQRARQDSGFSAEAARLKRIQADNAALDFEERTGRLVGKQGVEREFETLFQSLADRVASALRGIAGQLATLTDEREIAQLLRQTVDRAMNDLSAESATRLDEA